MRVLWGTRELQKIIMLKWRQKYLGTAYLRLSEVIFPKREEYLVLMGKYD